MEIVNKWLDISERELSRRNYRKAEAFLWKIKNNYPNYNIEDRLAQIKAEKRTWVANRRTIKIPVIVTTNSRELCSAKAKDNFNAETKLIVNGNNTNDRQEYENVIEKWLRISEEEYKRGDYAKAEKVLRRIKDVDPGFNVQRKLMEYDRARVMLDGSDDFGGSSHVSNDNYQNRNKRNATLSDFGNKKVEIFVKKANELLRNGNFTEAEKVLDEALYMPDSIKTLKAKIRDDRLKYENEKSAAEKQKHELFDNNVACLIDKANELFRNGYFCVAELHLEDAENLYIPDNVKRLKEKILNKKHEEENKKATVERQKLELFNQNVETLIHKANELLKDDNFTDAEKVLDEAESLYIPDNVKILKAKVRDSKEKVENGKIANEKKKIESLKVNERNALQIIENAKSSLLESDIKTTEKYLIEALELTSEIKSNQRFNAATKQALENEAFKFFKRAEKAFFDFKFDDADTFISISEHLHPDEYNKELMDLIANARKLNMTKEHMVSLKKKFFRNSDRNDDSTQIDFKKAFKITHGFDRADELLTSIMSLYKNDEAKQFFRNIKTVTEKQKINYDYNSNTRDSNKEDVYECLSKAKDALSRDDFETAIKLVKKSQRMFPTTEATTLLVDIARRKSEKESYSRNRENANMTEAHRCIDVIKSSLQKNDFEKLKRAFEKCLKMCPNPILKATFATFEEFVHSNDAEKNILMEFKPILSALSKGRFLEAKKSLFKITKFSDLASHMRKTIDSIEEHNRILTQTEIDKLAANYTKQANNEIQEGNFENAVFYLNITKDIKTNESIDAVLKRLNQVCFLKKEKEQANWWKKIRFYHRNNSEHDKMIDIACIYYVKGDFETALKHLTFVRAISYEGRRLKELVIEEMGSKA